MAHIIFYEKPGCQGNARQKALLLAAGHSLEVKNLLTEPWTRERLLAFLSPLPVPEWFNRAATMVKDGRVDPDQIGAEEAIALLLAHPLLIRRPLMQANGTCHVGFVQEAVDAWVGLAGQSADPEELGCQGHAHRCHGHHEHEEAPPNPDASCACPA
jgi:nitrogenase-associated protein